MQLSIKSQGEATVMPLGCAGLAVSFGPALQGGPKGARERFVFLAVSFGPALQGGPKRARERFAFRLTGKP